MKQPKKMASGALATRDAMKVPPKVPSSTPGAMPRTMSQRTAPCPWWARRLEIDVITIAAIDVPSDRCTRCSWPKPWAANIVVSTGTMMPPPPTPSSPAKKPTKAPSNR